MEQSILIGFFGWVDFKVGITMDYLDQLTYLFIILELYRGFSCFVLVLVQNAHSPFLSKGCQVCCRQTVQP